MYSMNIGHCLKCLKREACNRSDGACACTVDMVDITAHATRNFCPHPDGPRFGSGVSPAGWDDLPRLSSDQNVSAIPPSIAIPREQWPLAVRAVAKLATVEDVGVGDTVARVMDPLGGDLFQRWYKRIMGADCGCDNRQARLNVRYPYRGADHARG